MVLKLLGQSNSFACEGLEVSCIKNDTRVRRGQHPKLTGFHCISSLTPQNLCDLCTTLPPSPEQKAPHPDFKLKP